MIWPNFLARYLIMQTKTVYKIAKIKRTKQVRYFRLLKPRKSRMMSFFLYNKVKKRLKKKILVK